MAKSKGKPLTVVIMSGSTGHSAESLLNSALAQFDEPNIRVVKKKKVRSVQEARKIVRDAAEKQAVICHSLVSPKVRNAVVDEASELLVPAVDVLGGVLAMLSDHLHSAPRGEPGLAYKMQKEYFDRVAAVSFTLDHDDGRGLNGLRGADVVLVGVSRASKSVTCFYLAYRGVRAANVPLIDGHDPPPQLIKLPKKKVIGLTVSPARLQVLRETRRDLLRASKMESYVDLENVRREVMQAQAIMNKYEWPIIDVSYTAVEEVARRVLEIIGK